MLIRIYLEIIIIEKRKIDFTTMHDRKGMEKMYRVLNSVSAVEYINGCS